jgi:hypothetical protein
MDDNYEGVSSTESLKQLSSDNDKTTNYENIVNVDSCL